MINLFLGNDNAFVRLNCEQVLADDSPGAGDVAFDIELAADGFSGQNATVWVGRPELMSFLGELETLSETLQGSAKLCDMSYGSEFDGFSLEISSLDGSGHLGVQAEMQKPVAMGNRRKLGRLGSSVCFEIELTNLAQFLKSLQQFMMCC